MNDDSTAQSRKSDYLRDAGAWLTSIVATFHGIPIPPTVVKSLAKVFQQLVEKSGALSLAWLDSKLVIKQAEREGLRHIMSVMAKNAAASVEQDSALQRRAKKHFMDKIFGEQANRESIVVQAVAELTDDPPKADSIDEIDTDWLNMFETLASKTSKVDAQAILAKILAGEIRAPGTFSRSTLQKLATLDPRTGRLLQKFSSLCVEIVDPEEEIGQYSFLPVPPFFTSSHDGLKPFGLSYNAITDLQDEGLVKAEMEFSHRFSAVYLASEYSIGGVRYRANFPHQQDPGITITTSGLMFTKVGAELLQVVPLEPDLEFNNHYNEWLISLLRSMFQANIVTIDRLDSGDFER